MQVQERRRSRRRRRENLNIKFASIKPACYRDNSCLKMTSFAIKWFICFDCLFHEMKKEMMHTHILCIQNGMTLKCDNETDLRSWMWL